MSESLSVRLVQWASSIEAADNRAALGRVEMDADLVVLPEAFARDFGPAGSDLGPSAEALDGPFVSAVRRRVGDGVLVAGMFETSADPDRPFNTLVAIGADSTETYRKIHLYDSFGHRESDVLTAGPITPTVIDVKGWRVGLMTCYDLRFPELARLLVDAGAEVLVIPAAWVAGPRKVDHWRTLVRARAIENTAYVVAVGQPAPRYTGHSMVVAPDGDLLVEAGDDAEVLDATLERARLVAAREANPSLANRRLGGH